MEAPELPRIDPAVRVIRLGDWRTAQPRIRRTRRRQFPLVERALARDLRRERPDALIAAANQANLLVDVAAHRRAGCGQALLARTAVLTQVMALCVMPGGRRPRIAASTPIERLQQTGYSPQWPPPQAINAPLHFGD